MAGKVGRMEPDRAAEGIEVIIRGMQVSLAGAVLLFLTPWATTIESLTAFYYWQPSPWGL